MNSSTSSSEAASRRWWGFAATLVAAAAVLLAATIAVAYALDPYDTGRSWFPGKAGLRPRGPRTAAASRGRDPAFDAAVLGNSRIQLLSPARLGEKTGLNFVQLSVPGTGPREEMTILGWFIANHPGTARAVVVSADETWCTADPALPAPNPFPFWLFSESRLSYAAGLLRYDTLEEIPRRLRYVSGLSRDRARPDGYWDYDAEYQGSGLGDEGADAGGPSDAVGANPSGRFPAADALAAVVRALPDDLRLVIVFPPLFGAALPEPGSARAANDQACKDAVLAAARGHSRTASVDWRVERPENRNPRYFIDQVHFRQPVARLIEGDIAAALETLR
jgi:hypothetical protein